MTSREWAAVGALAGVGVLVLTWRRTLPSAPLGFTFDPATSDLSGYGPQLPNADQPNTAQINATDENSATYSGYRKGGSGGFVSTFLGKVLGRTWGVPQTTVQSPSIPNVGIVPGQAPRNMRWFDPPSVSPDPDVLFYAGDPTGHEYDLDLG